MDDMLNTVNTPGPGTWAGFLWPVSLATSKVIYGIDDLGTVHSQYSGYLWPSSLPSFTQH